MSIVRGDEKPRVGSGEDAGDAGPLAHPVVLIGTEINRALGSRKIDLGLEAGLAIVVLAIILDRATRIGVGGKK